MGNSNRTRLDLTVAGGWRAVIFYAAMQIKMRSNFVNFAVCEVVNMNLSITSPIPQPGQIICLEQAENLPIDSFQREDRYSSDKQNGSLGKQLSKTYEFFDVNIETYFSPFIFVKQQAKIHCTQGIHIYKKYTFHRRLLQL